MNQIFLTIPKAILKNESIKKVVDELLTRLKNSPKVTSVLQNVDHDFGRYETYLINLIADEYYEDICLQLNYILSTSGEMLKLPWEVFTPVLEPSEGI